MKKVLQVLVVVCVSAFTLASQAQTAGAKSICMGKVVAIADPDPQWIWVLLSNHGEPIDCSVLRNVEIKMLGKNSEVSYSGNVFRGVEHFGSWSYVRIPSGNSK